MRATQTVEVDATTPIPFGMHSGQPIREVLSEYLVWLWSIPPAQLRISRGIAYRTALLRAVSDELQRRLDRGDVIDELQRPPGVALH